MMYIFKILWISHSTCKYFYCKKSRIIFPRGEKKRFPEETKYVMRAGPSPARNVPGSHLAE